jgi:Mn-dependent DtxR family transcriptional regulator
LLFDTRHTQEFLGQVLGVQRASISIVNALQKTGLIRYRRGHMDIFLKPSVATAGRELVTRRQIAEFVALGPHARAQLAGYVFI